MNAERKAGVCGWAIVDARCLEIGKLEKAPLVPATSARPSGGDRLSGELTIGSTPPDAGALLHLSPDVQIDSPFGLDDLPEPDLDGAVAFVRSSISSQLSEPASEPPSGVRAGSEPGSREDRVDVGDEFRPLRPKNVPDRRGLASSSSCSSSATPSSS